METTRLVPTLSRLVAAATAALALGAAPDAEASLTFQTSAGASYIVDGPSQRGPFTFELGPGWQLGWLRLELPAVFASQEDSVFPRTSGAFLGLRPSVKLFPTDGLYGKLSTQIFWSDEGSHVGLGVGGGFEWRLVDALAVFAEGTVNPYLESDRGLPIELRAGATLVF